MCNACDATMGENQVRIELHAIYLSLEAHATVDVHVRTYT